MPLDPIVTGSLISAGANLLGGLMGNSGPSKFEKQMARDQFAYQKARDRESIQWRVADARAAGLHPLYALGAQVAPFSPVFTSGGGPNPMGGALAAAGQDIGRAVAARATPEQREIVRLQLEGLALDNMGKSAEIDLLNSQRRRNDMESLQSSPVPVNATRNIVIESPDVVGRGGVQFNDARSSSGGLMPATGHESWPWVAGTIQPSAPPVPAPSSKNRNLFAGSRPMFGEYRMPGGEPMVLPGGSQSGDAAEALESIGESLLLMRMTYLANVEVYGEEHAQRLMAKYVRGKDLDRVGGFAFESVFGEPLYNPEGPGSGGRLRRATRGM